ncbi:MAG TPA: non-homologous end-joining DNA ligase [Lapillicoccus sp.]|nr:non-homologous end-joining DNA ligase [Lapillicoccus sp.]
MAAKDATTVQVPGPDGDREVRISSPDRELWPGTGITKLELAEYFVAVGGWFMPIVGHRPITLQRFPTGIDGEEFFAKNPPRGVPDYAQTVTLTYPSGRKHPQLVLNELAVAVWAVQMNTITIHPWPVSITGTKGDTDNPDELRIDLDPQPGRDFHDAAVAALELRKVLADLDLTAYAKTSGNRGVHVHARIEPTHEFLDVRHGVIAIARELERRLPDLVTTSWWKEERGEKVFVDFNQANRDRTIASAFSPRPLLGAPVSMPVAWDDLTGVSPADFTVRTVPALVAKGKDPWGSMPDSVGTIDGALEWWERDVADGLPELNFPPDYPKMPGEPPRVQPSKKKYDDDSEYLPDEGGYLRDNPQGPPGGWDSPHRRRRR